MYVISLVELTLTDDFIREGDFFAFNSGGISDNPSVGNCATGLPLVNQECAEQVSSRDIDVISHL
jgi:hypothetical protein